MEDLVRIILTSGEGEDQMRLHYSITKEAEAGALEMLDKEKKPISHQRRTEIYLQAMEKFPVKE